MIESTTASSGSEPATTSTRQHHYAAVIGIDWGHSKHVFAMCLSQLPNNWDKGSFVTAEVNEWITQLRQRFANARVAIAVESHRGALIYALAAHADFLDLFLIPTTSSAHYRRAFVPSGAKDDAPDAQWLGDLLFHHQDRLRRWEPDDPDTRLLAALCEQRRQVIAERTRLSSQLGYKLKLCAPVVLDMCEHIASDMGLELLRRWPSLDKLKAAKPETLRAFFHQHHVRRPKCVQERLDLVAKANAVVTDPAVLIPAHLAVAGLVRQLSALLPVIADYDERISALYAKHADSFIFRSLPGAGPALGPRLLCAFGSQRYRWPDAMSIQTFSGIAPVRIVSGNSRLTRKRSACPKYLRQTFHEFAASSIKFCGWARALYERLRARGNSYHTAVRTIAWRWLRILWRIWHDRVTYDEAIFTGSQHRHQQAKPQAAP